MTVANLIATIIVLSGTIGASISCAAISLGLTIIMMC